MNETTPRRHVRGQAATPDTSTRPALTAPGRRFARAGAVLLATLALASDPGAVGAQDALDGLRAPSTSLRSVTPGLRYRAGWVHEFMLGKGYRDLWTSEIDVPVLDLGRFAGGLTPLESFGFGQTQGLLFAAGDGSPGYRFRSVDKRRSQGLDPELRGTIAEWILQDQTAVLHPGGAPVIASIMEYLELLDANPVLVALPDDPRLGEFREEFAGMLGYLEANVNEGPDGTPGFAGATEVSGTESLLERIHGSSRERVAAEEYLKARLVDMLVGDRDRHAGQWRWVREPVPGGGHRWRPVALDRDEAFYAIGGIYGMFVRGTLPKLVPFEREYGTIRGLTWNGWSIDRILLSGIERAAWDSIVGAVQRQVTDDVIDQAVLRMPEAMASKRAGWMADALKNRRDNLALASEKFYEIVFAQVEIHGTEREDLVLVDRRPDGSIDVRLYDIHDDEGGRAAADRGIAPEGAPYFRRRYLPWETAEIRIYARGAADRALVRSAPVGSAGGAPAPRGAAPGDPVGVRVIGGEGDDLYRNPGDSAPGATAFYDEHGDNDFSGVASDTRADTRPYVRPPGEDPFHFYALDWGTQWYPTTVYDLNSDHGFIVEMGRIRYDYGFRKQPYAHRMLVKGGISTDGRLMAEYRSHFREIATGVDADVGLRVSGYDKFRFYGMGNDSPFPDDEESTELDRYHLEVDPKLVLPYDSGRVSLALGPVLRWSHIDTDSGDLLRQIGGLYGDGDFWQVGGRISITVDERDHPVWPRRGFMLHLEGTAYPEALDARTDYEKVEGNLLGYVPLPNRSTLALRVGGAKVVGDFPFFDAAMLGSRRVRGLNNSRFRGDASLYGGIELRLPLFRAPLPLAGFQTEFGITGFTDAGRVWLDGATPGGWHTGGGGGIWFSPLNRDLTFRFTVASSEEVRVKFGSGFRF